MRGVPLSLSSLCILMYSRIAIDIVYDFTVAIEGH